jgi:plastocyanin
MRKRFWMVLAVPLLLVGACGDDDDDADAGGGDGTTSTVEDAGGGDAAGGPATYDVQVDAAFESFTVAALAYFPNELTVHPGDTVDFTGIFSGEPHTVTFGTLVTDGLASSDPETGEEGPELASVPPLLPDGPGDAIQAAAQPCFLAEGAPPESGDACSADEQEQPAFDGSQTYYNSGFLADGDVFSVPLSDDIAPGDYSFFCTLHRGGMTGTLTVVGPDDEADTPDDVESAGADALAAMEEELAPVAEAMEQGTLPPFITEAAPGSVIAGGSTETSSGIVSQFGPETVDIAVGDTVTWTVLGPHTVSFGASEAQRSAIARAPDGSVHVNPDSFAPAGGEGQPPPDESAPPGPPINFSGGEYAGTGFRNSGIILSFPPQLYSYSLTFTTPGTYEYYCLVHPDMEGTVNVA